MSTNSLSLQKKCTYIEIRTRPNDNDGEEVIDGEMYGKREREKKVYIQESVFNVDGLSELPLFFFFAVRSVSYLQINLRRWWPTLPYLFSINTPYMVCIIR